jgi:hypothetical protein
MDGAALPHVQMLADAVAHCREQLGRCQPRERFEREKSLQGALDRLKDYIACPDPDRDKELKRMKAVMRAAALAAHPDLAAIDVLQRASAL